MNMSFGVAAAPPGPTEMGGADPPSASSTSTASSAPLPPVPAPFSLPSANFTFQAPPANLMPPSRPPAAPSAAFPFTGAPRFVYSNPPTGVSSSAIPPPAPPFSGQPGFIFQGPSGNPLPSGGAPGQSMLGMKNLQPGGVGQSSAVAIRPFHPTALQTTLSAPAQAGPLRPPLQVSGTPGPQAGSAASAEGAGNQGTPPITMSAGTGTSTESSAVVGGFVGSGTQARPVVGQIQMPSVPPSIGGVVGARPGLVLPSSTAVPFVPPRPAFATNAVTAPAIVPPGVLSYCFGEAAKLLTLLENIKHLL